jgi:putative membrane protein
MHRLHAMALIGLAASTLPAWSLPAWAAEPATETQPAVPAPAPVTHPAHASTSEADESVPKTTANAALSPKQTAGDDPDPASAKAAADFVLKAGIDGMTEVQLGRLALTTSHNERVRELAQHIVTDHDQANTKLGEVALMKNISMPKQLDAAHATVIQQLTAKQGQAFDVAYVNQTITAHARAITLFTAAAGQSDSEIAAFAYRTLPSLKAHKQMAEALRSGVHAESDGAKGS